MSSAFVGCGFHAQLTTRRAVACDLLSVTDFCCHDFFQPFVSGREEQAWRPHHNPGAAASASSLFLGGAAFPFFLWRSAVSFLLVVLLSPPFWRSTAFTVLFLVNLLLLLFQKLRM